MELRKLLVVLFLGSTVTVVSQDDRQLLAHDTEELATEDLEDDLAPLNMYEGLNRELGGDSVRTCNGYACIGWVEDHYPDGSLKHRGYYDDGQLIHYRNHHPSGSIEREFRVIDNIRSVMRTYYPDGTLRTESRYRSGTVIAYEDHYRNGQLRYEEERHRSEPYFLKMNLYAEDGTPISTLELEDRKRIISVQREYHPNGLVRVEGKVRYDPARMDSQRIGDWTYRDADGRPLHKEQYIDGRVHEVTDL